MESRWRRASFAWFLGSNDLSVPLVDLETGSCRDGLHPDRANENRGGELVVSYLLGLAEIRQLARVNAGRRNLPHFAPSAPEFHLSYSSEPRTPCHKPPS